MITPRLSSVCLAALLGMVAGMLFPETCEVAAQDAIFATPNAPTTSALNTLSPGQSLGDLVRQAKYQDDESRVDKSAASERTENDLELEDSELSEDELTESLTDSDDKAQSDDEIDGDSDDEDSAAETDTDVVSARAKATANHIRRLRKPVHTIGVDLNAEAVRPENKAALQDSAQIHIVALGCSGVTPNRYTVGFRHRPLYFEQADLERCGNAHGFFQNVISGFHFAANTMTLPYQMRRQPPQCTVPTPGDCQTCESMDSACLQK